jgi:hypothetical protein
MFIEGFSGEQTSCILLSEWVIELVLSLVRALLYYPFASFFVIFNHITRYPKAPTTGGDLDLLATTIPYLHAMKSKLHIQPVVLLELEQMAEYFVKLAHSAVSRGPPNHSSNNIQDYDTT